MRRNTNDAGGSDRESRQEGRSLLLAKGLLLLAIVGFAGVLLSLVWP